MRLVCPNCDAEYEVDDAAIPRTGRDVQCSNCGHAWFQTHAEALAEDLTLLAGAAEGAVEAAGGAEEDTVPALEAEAAVAQDVAVDLTEVSGDSEAPAVVAELTPEPVVEPVTEAAAATRNIDDSVMAVLREEAAREVAARRAETPAPVLETQTEMRLAPAAEVSAHPVAASPVVANLVVARLKGEPEPKPEAQAARPRRDLLPAIEEINSTLRASSGRSSEDEQSRMAAEAAQAGRRSFGNGFLTLVLLGAILLALYVFAPLIAAKVPALAGTALAYVTWVDAARIWLDAEIRTLIGMLRGLEGSSQG